MKRLYSEDGLSDGGDFDLKSRHRCTDPLCCLLFLAALGMFGFLYRICLMRGDLGRLYHGIDYNGRVCGVDKAVEGKPFLYWCATRSSNGGLEFNAAKPICVSSCPTGAFSMEPECAFVSGSLSQLMGYKTVVLMDRYCIPDVSEEKGLTNQLTSQLNNFDTSFSEELSSIPAAWPTLLGAFVVSVLMGYLYLVMLRHCAEVLIWLSIVGSIGGFVVLGGYIWVNGDHVVRSVMYENEQVATELQDLKGHEQQAAKIAAGVCWAVAAGLICVANCLQQSIHVAACCAEVACEAIFEMPSLLLAPLCKVALKVSALAVLGVGFLLMWSAIDMTPGDDGVIRTFSPTDEEKAALLFYVTVSLWILAFINAMYQFIVAYAVVEYYYTPCDASGRKEHHFCALLEGLQVGLFLHCGSLALGSLLIALLTVAHWLLRLAEHYNKSHGNNPLVRALLCCTEFFVNCCREILSRINRIAYIEMAISSQNFCDSAQTALGVISAVIASMGILNGATMVFTIFGALILTLGASFFAYTMANGSAYMDETSTFHCDSPVTVTWAAAAIGFVVALSFMNIFDVASDTLLYCYQTDRQSGKGASTAPPILRGLFDGR